MVLSWSYVLLWIAALLYAAYVTFRRQPVGLAATLAATLSWGLLTAGLADRGLAAGHWPLVGRYEFPLCFTWAILTLYLALETGWQERRAGAFVLAVALAVGGYAASCPLADKNPSPLPPVLRSPWLQGHALSAVIGYGAFAVAAGTAVARLLAGPSPSSGAEGRGWLPSAEDLERMMEWSLTFGFPWLTFAILAGAIWAQNAWGRYWGWDPKETWSLVVWLWYVMILHLRPLRSWRGRRLAILALIGLGLVFFSFVGVPWLVRRAQLESLHGF